MNYRKAMSSIDSWLWALTSDWPEEERRYFLDISRPWYGKVGLLLWLLVVCGLTWKAFV